MQKERDSLRAGYTNYFQQINMDVPSALVYEILENKPIYYKGYESVLNKSKKVEDIVGSSSLQAEIISCLLKLFFIYLEENEYRIYTNKIGLYIDKGNNLSGDICIFKNAAMTADKIDNHYINIPAELQIEIDIKGDIADAKQQKYMTDKTNKLLQFGTKKIIWILTDSYQVMIAEPDKDWLIFDWGKAFVTINGISANIGQHFVSNGITIQ